MYAANIHDTKVGVFTFEKALYRYPTIVAGCADQGYRGTFKNTFEFFIISELIYLHALKIILRCSLFVGLSNGLLDG